MDWLIQAVPNYETWWRIAVSQLGIPGAMMLAVVFCFWKGWIVPGWAVDRERQIITEKDEENDQLQAELRDERQRYRDLLLAHSDLTKRAVEATTAAAKAITPGGQ